MWWAGYLYHGARRTGQPTQGRKGTQALACSREHLDKMCDASLVPLGFSQGPGMLQKPRVKARLESSTDSSPLRPSNKLQCGPEWLSVLSGFMTVPPCSLVYKVTGVADTRGFSL